MEPIFILDQTGITVEQATTDADIFVSTAMELAGSEEAVVLVGTDADLLVMLVARTPPDAKLFLLRPGMNTKPAKGFNISAIHQAVGDRKQNLVFLHAITGVIYRLRCIGKARQLHFGYICPIMTYLATK